MPMIAKVVLTVHARTMIISTGRQVRRIESTTRRMPLVRFTKRTGRMARPSRSTVSRKVSANEREDDPMMMMAGTSRCCG
eukprot:2033233-Rhodomonas_salina.1